MRKFIPYPLSKSQRYFFNHGKWEKSSQSATMEERNGLRLSAATAGLHYSLGGERERAGLVRNKKEGKKTKIPTKGLRGQ